MATLSLGSAEIYRDFVSNFDEKQLEDSSGTDLYSPEEYLLDPTLHDSTESWWVRNVVRTSTLAVHPDTGLTDPFTPLAEKNPALLPLIAAIVSDKASMETLEIVAKLPSVADTQSIDYMLEFMSSGLDPPDDTSVLQKEAPKKPSSTPQQKQSDKTPAGSGGPDPEKEPDPNEDLKNKAVELKEKKVHGNDHSRVGPARVYLIIERLPGGKEKILKVGETIVDYVKGQLPRARLQVKQLERLGKDVFYRVEKWLGKTKLEGKTREFDRVKELRSQGHELPLNKRPKIPPTGG